MPRAKKIQQKVLISKKTTGLCPSRSYYSMATINKILNSAGFIVTIFYSVNIFKESGILLDEFYATIILGK